jgi:DNA mismatch repair protein MutS
MSRSARDTPMMRQYLGIKARYPDAFIFYRMGDFYELFFEDAERAAPLLDITLTTRDRGKPDAVPMCGVPVHSADGYLKRLADLGHRVAICEQVEDPKSTGGHRLVRRDVVEVVTPGLVGDPEGLDAARELIVAAIAMGTPQGEAGVAALDASTGSFRATDVSCGDGGELPAALLEELERIGPREVLVAAPSAEQLRARIGERLPGAALTAIDPAIFEPRDERLVGPGAGGRAASAILAFLEAHQPFALRHAPELRRYRLGDAMVLDAATRTHLELFESLEDRSRKGTLIHRIDATITPLGTRRLARWVAYPLLDRQEIRHRQKGVACLADRDRSRDRLRKALAGVRDLERIFAKVARPGAQPRDLAALRSSVAALPDVAAAFAGEEGDLLAGDGSRPPALVFPEPLPEVEQLLFESIVEDPPVVPRGSRGANETGYIRAGFRPELDALRESARKGREWIAGLEVRERERTGVSNLKVRFHPVHGYSLEVGKSHLGRIPDDYERKQTLANAERFTTPELREMEAKVLGANERAAALEREVFESVRQSVLEQAAGIRAAAEATASLDALQSLAEVARRDGWVRPVVEESDLLEIRAGRHPVVEPLLAARTGEEFVPNDTDLDPASTRILLITGPNMAGKSTYLRQVALLVLLAQIGSFVPAESARIGIVDRIFTRVGATDRLTRGESTFMVEMRETAEILTQATSSSLIILDEIGRGTSTFDGLSIAWAVAEYLHDTPGLGPRTLFATHYHELADLARTRSGVRNAHFEAREWGEEVLFLRQLVPGEASRSYGIQVARLAGLPATVLERAREILHNLESEELGEDGRPRLAEHGRTEGESARSEDDQLVLFGGNPTRDPAETEVLDELREVDPDRTTPMEALALLARLISRLRGGRTTR